MKKTILLICLALAVQLLATGSADAIVVVVTANVLASNCCYVIPLVSGITSVTVSNPEPAWNGQPIDWINSFNVFACINWPVTYDEFCCIGSGNSAQMYDRRHDVPCPVAAMATTHASVGGYGLLPYVSDFAQSWCEEPCLGPFCE